MTVRTLKIGVFVACLLPFSKIVADLAGIAGGSLGANPVEDLTHRLGWWGLTLLLATLAVTPLRDLSGWSKLIRIRRMLGLFVFFYIVLHFLVFVWLDQRWDLAAIIEDIAERPYITIGVLALTLLTPLALTSSNAMMRRLGKRWKKLHSLVYPIVILGLWHFFWQVKKDLLEPLIFASIAAILLGYRIWKRRRRLRSAAA